jgi:CBS domain-containing protein
MRQLTDVDGLAAADVVHGRLTSLPASTTVGELRDYFAASTSRNLAVLVDGDRYLGSLTPSAIPDGADAGARAADYASREPVVAPGAAATTARDLALEQPSLRLPVVADDGSLVGVVAVDETRTGFCGT